MGYYLLTYVQTCQFKSAMSLSDLAKLLQLKPAGLAYILYK